MDNSQKISQSQQQLASHTSDDEAHEKSNQSVQQLASPTSDHGAQENLSQTLDDEAQEKSNQLVQQLASHTSDDEAQENLSQTSDDEAQEKLNQSQQQLASPTSDHGAQENLSQSHEPLASPVGESEVLSDAYVASSVIDEDSVEIPIIPNLQKFAKHTEVQRDGEVSPTGLLRVSLVKKNAGKRVWDKVMACCFCPALLKNKISEHHIKVHSMESDVGRVLLNKPGTPERKWGWERLKKSGQLQPQCCCLGVWLR